MANLTRIHYTVQLMNVKVK